MKAVIETAIVKTGDWDTDSSVFDSFNNILESITLADDMDELIRFMSHHIPVHFKWGFGSSHFWVHQKYGYGPKAEIIDNRIIFVEYQS